MGNDGDDGGHYHVCSMLYLSACPFLHDDEDGGEDVEGFDDSFGLKELRQGMV